MLSAQRSPSLRAKNASSSTTSAATSQGLAAAQRLAACRAGPAAARQQPGMPLGLSQR